MHKTLPLAGFSVPPKALARVRSASDVIISAGAALAGTVVAVALLIGTARGQEPDSAGFFFDLFAGPRGSPVGAMRHKLTAGPFPELSICYSVGALSIQVLNEKNEDRDFAGRCEPGPLLSLREMTRRALDLLRRAHEGEPT